MTLSFYHHSTTPPKSSIGEMALNLTKMLDAGYPVPKGFIVSAQTCSSFFAHARLRDKIQLLIDRCDFHNPQDTASVSKNIRKLIMSAEIPGEISEPMLEAAVKLGKNKVMLTPSPISETSGSESVYGLSGEAAILMGIRELWINQFAPGELYNIQSTGEFPSMAICVQIEPSAVASGVLVTSNGDKTVCKISAVFGEGGYLNKLQGADVHTLVRGSGQERDKQRNLQTKEVIFSHGKAETKDVPSSRQKKQKLTESALKELATLAERIQKDKFFPQQVTFVFDGKKVFVINLKPAHDQQEEVVDTPSQASSHRILLKGLGMTPGIITGMVRVVRPQTLSVGTGDILVASKLSHLTPELLRTAKGVIVEEDTPANTVLQLANRGIAFLMNAAGAVDLLEPGAFVTLHTPRGEVLAGGYRNVSQEPEKAPAQLAIRIGTEVNLADPSRSLPTSRGHIILSPNELIMDLGTHPMKLAKEKKARVLTEAILSALRSSCAYHKNESVIYSFSHLTSREYAQLSGGRQYESVVEENPQLGYFGSARLLSLPQLAAMEIEAVEAMRRESFGKRISLLLPAVRTTFEISQWQRLLSEKLPRSASLRYFVDLSIPSLCWQIPQIAQMVDGVILDLDQITQYLFGIDLNSSSFRYQPLDFEPTIKAILNAVDLATKQQGMYLILKGSMLSHDPYLSFAVERGIHEVNLPQQALISSTQRLMVLEQERVAHV